MMQATVSVRVRSFRATLAESFGGMADLGGWRKVSDDGGNLQRELLTHPPGLPLRKPPLETLFEDGPGEKQKPGKLPTPPPQSRKDGPGEEQKPGQLSSARPSPPPPPPQSREDGPGEEQKPVKLSSTPTRQPTQPILHLRLALRNDGTAEQAASSAPPPTPLPNRKPPPPPQSRKDGPAEQAASSAPPPKRKAPPPTAPLPTQHVPAKKEVKGDATDTARSSTDRYQHSTAPQSREGTLESPPPTPAEEEDVQLNNQLNRWPANPGLELSEQRVIILGKRWKPPTEPQSREDGPAEQAASAQPPTNPLPSSPPPPPPTPPPTQHGPGEQQRPSSAPPV